MLLLRTAVRNAIYFLQNFPATGRSTGVSGNCTFGPASAQPGTNVLYNTKREMLVIKGAVPCFPPIWPSLSAFTSLRPHKGFPRRQSIEFLMKNVIILFPDLRLEV